MEWEEEGGCCRQEEDSPSNPPIFLHYCSRPPPLSLHPTRTIPSPPASPPRCQSCRQMKQETAAASQRLTQRRKTHREERETSRTQAVCSSPVRRRTSRQKNRFLHVRQASLQTSRSSNTKFHLNERRNVKCTREKKKRSR